MKSGVATTLKDLTLRAWEKYSEYPAAAAEIVRLAKNHPDILAELALMGANQAIRLHANTVRMAVTAPVDFDVATAGRKAGARLEARMRNAGLSYEFPLPGGKRIGDATVADLDAAIAFHTAQAAGHQSSIAAYSTVKTMLAKSGKATVREAIPDESLAAVLRGAKEGVAA